jgi:hypothetical protein
MSSPLITRGDSEVNTASSALRNLREKMGLTTRDVEAASAALARKRGSRRYAIPISRLCDFETRGTIPNIYRLYTLSLIYRVELQHLLRLYGIGVEPPISDPQAGPSVVSRHCSCVSAAPHVDLPVLPKNTFASRKTAYLGQIVGELTEPVPLFYFQHFLNSGSTYGYIGTEDWTMWPLLPPASLVQIDESRNRVSSGAWASEYERPIYFVETRERHVCCWCTANRDGLILTPHPLSPVQPRILRHHDAEILGQVVGATLMLRRHCFAAGPSAAKMGHPFLRPRQEKSGSGSTL